ncbi:RNA polymerase sigma factor [Paenibacillus gorillae]|uniref:RNA polymerase sigma factor n=1 Tax=Paenibacillus gorillae TaxID=1243662 RepID=UPI0004B03BA1|nr:sigma-70 family RNA polymerase sigma factor [Paenibacillus gorillae]
MGAEQEMIDRLRSGDESALRQLMERYGNEVLRTAVLLLRDRHLAEDVSQDVFIDVYRKINQLKADRSLRAWLIAMTVNRCRERMRRASWKRLLFRERLEEEAGAAIGPGSEGWAVSATIQSIIMALPLRYREVIVLHYYQDMAIADIAETLDEPEGTIKSKLQRGRKLLKTSLVEGGWRDEALFEGQSNS